MKLQKVSQTITPFAGISFIHEEFNKSGLSYLIDNHLGARKWIRQGRQWKLGLYTARPYDQLQFT
ncbi:MAG: hypothetical protein PWQ17_2624 [Anaerophaga sp.]|jgi:hypothetical protein|nr:hypothetical protein [Methermicoccus sp.]MDK2843117.1 hypothetical protein [Anaerophaga sp.]